VYLHSSGQNFWLHF